MEIGQKVNLIYKDKRTAVIVRSKPDEQGNIQIEYEGNPEKPWGLVNPEELEKREKPSQTQKTGKSPTNPEEPPKGSSD